MNKTKSNKEKSCRQVTPQKKRESDKARNSHPVWPCEALCAALPGAAGQTPARAVRADLGRFPTTCGGRKLKLDKRVTSRQRFRQAQLPAVRAVSRGSGIRRSDITNKDFHQR